VSVNVVRVGDIAIGALRFTVIAGPCVIEDLETCITTANVLKGLADRYDFNYIFKSSYEKDNRSRVDAYAGPGLDDGLAILEEVKQTVGVPILSDVHCSEQVGKAAKVLDVIQIPAYLSQQTRLAVTVGKSGKPVNVKKGQFVAPEDMKGVVSKVRSTGNNNILLTERGSCFGYRRLIVDMRSFPIMRSLGCPVVFDVTHAIRIYGYPSSDPKGGEPQFIYHLARAAVACGVDGLFFETHPVPRKAKCDAASMLPLIEAERLLAEVAAINAVVEKLHLGKV